MITINELGIEEAINTLFYAWLQRYSSKHKPTHCLLGIEEALSLGMELRHKQVFGSLNWDGGIPSEYRGMKIIIKQSPGIELGFDSKDGAYPLICELAKKRPTNRKGSE